MVYENVMALSDASPGEDEMHRKRCEIFLPGCHACEGFSCKFPEAFSCDAWSKPCLQDLGVGEGTTAASPSGYAMVPADERLLQSVTQ